MDCNVCRTSELLSTFVQSSVSPYPNDKGRRVIIFPLGICFSPFFHKTFTLNGSTRAERVPGHCTVIPRDAQRAHEPEKGTKQILKCTPSCWASGICTEEQTGPKVPAYLCEAFSCYFFFFFSEEKLVFQAGRIKYFQVISNIFLLYLIKIDE